VKDADPGPGPGIPILKETRAEYAKAAVVLNRAANRKTNLRNRAINLTTDASKTVH